MQGKQSESGRRATAANVGGKERLASMFLGGGLVAYALARRGLVPKLLLLPGVMLLARGRSGRSLAYTLFDVSTAPEGRAKRRLGEARRAEAREGGAAEAAAETPSMSYEPSPDAPHPDVPGTHGHPVPPTDLGVPSVQVTEKLMSEVAAGQGGGESETEPESER